MDSPMLELVEVDGFTQEGHGWGHGWAEWHENKRRDRRAVEFSFIEDDEEVARARIYPKSSLGVPYEGLRAGPFVEIDLVVVREDMRGDDPGRGLQALALLVGHYQGQEMFAFSAADRFWAKAGWKRVTERDSDDLAWPLYVYLLNKER